MKNRRKRRIKRILAYYSYSHGQISDEYSKMAPNIIELKKVEDEEEKDEAEKEDD